MNVWNVLGIEANSDADTIRRAYAQKVRQFHPEEYPQEFQRLNEAYRRALALATSSRHHRTADIDQPVTGFPAYPSRENPVSFDFTVSSLPGNDQPEASQTGYDFEAIEKAAHSAENRRQTMIAVLKEAYTLLSGGNSQLKVWRAFLHSESFTLFMDEPEFIGELTNMLRNDYYTIRHHVYIEIKRAFFSNGQRNSKLPPYRQLARLLPILISRSRARNPNHTITVAAITVPLVFVFAACLSFMVNGWPSSSAPPEPTAAFSMLTNPLLPSDAPSPDTVGVYLNHKYQGLTVTIPGEAESSGVLNAYRCSLPAYDDLEFDVYQYIFSYEPDSAYDNLIEAALEKTLASMNIEGAYDACSGVVYLPVKNDGDLETLAAALPKLPEVFFEAYPFAKGFDVSFCVLPAGSPYAYPAGIGRPLFTQDWFSDEATSLETFHHMLYIYTSDITPWLAADPLQQGPQYEDALSVLVDGKPRTFSDVRTDQGYITAGNVYRLCLNLDIPVKINSNGEFILGDDGQTIVFSDRGDLAIDIVASDLGLTLADGETS